MLTTSAWRWWLIIPAAWFMLNPLRKLGKLIWNLYKIESFYAIKCKLHIFLQVRSSWLRDQLLQPAQPGGRGEVTGSVRVEYLVPAPLSGSQQTPASWRAPLTGSARSTPCGTAADTELQQNIYTAYYKLNLNKLSNGNWRLLIAFRPSFRLKSKKVSKF